MILHARNLALGGRLEPTSIELGSGALTCLIGPNGSGKTSLLHGLAGIGKPSGRVDLDGVELRTLPPPERMRLLSYLPATRDLPWPIPAADVVRLGLSGAGSPGAVEQVMDLLEIGPLAGRRVDRLSTGERSRVLLARALVSSPRLLLLDEPTANLDPLWQLHLIDHLRVLAREDGMVILIALHDLELAERYADRILIMDRGAVAADGSPDQIIGSERFREIFGIERGSGEWRPLRRRADPRSSR